jgi:hypothetical protein
MKLRKRSVEENRLEGSEVGRQFQFIIFIFCPGVLFLPLWSMAALVNSKTHCGHLEWGQLENHKDHDIAVLIDNRTKLEYLRGINQYFSIDP